MGFDRPDMLTVSSSLLLNRLPNLVGCRRDWSNLRRFRILFEADLSILRGSAHNSVLYSPRTRMVNFIAVQMTSP
jgi:hypothetical protein